MAKPSQMRLFKTIQYTPNVASAISLVNQNRYSFGAAIRKSSAAPTLSQMRSNAPALLAGWR
jgi:hypothetical protein